MKNAKVFLTATAIFAIVGSALAFKAKYSVDYCYAAVPTSGVCSTSVTGTGEITSGDLNGTTAFCYAVKGTAACTSTAVPNKGNVEVEP